MTTHALLGPSAAERWLHCAGSVAANLTAKREGGRNVYADEGTAAHLLFELCLRTDSPPESFEGAKLPFGHSVDDDMISAVGHAFDYVRRLSVQHPKHTLHIEHRVNVGKVLELEPEILSGTPDAIFHASEANVLWTIDYKHGIGVAVEVAGNPQLKLYAAGKMHELGWKRHKIINAVVQPRAPGREPILEEELDSEHIYQWMHDVVKPQVIKIFKGGKKGGPNPLAERVGGTWCRWCAVAGTCKAYADAATRSAMREFNPVYEPMEHRLLDLSMTAEQLAQALNAASLLEQWIHDIRAHALDALLAGQRVPGWEAGYTTPRRIWLNEQDTQSFLASFGFSIDEYAPRETLSPAQAEKLLRAKKLIKGKSDILAPLVTRSIPERKLVRSDDV